MFADLGAEAPDINRMIEELGPFSEAGHPRRRVARRRVGDRHARRCKDLLPITKDLRRFAKIAQARSARPRRRVLESFQRGRGIQRLLDYAFYQVAAINGFDSFGHYLRARL